MLGRLGTEYWSVTPAINTVILLKSRCLAKRGNYTCHIMVRLIGVFFTKLLLGRWDLRFRGDRITPHVFQPCKCPCKEGSGPKKPDPAGTFVASSPRLSTTETLALGSLFSMYLHFPTKRTGPKVPPVSKKTFDRKPQQNFGAFQISNNSIAMIFWQCK